MARIIMEGDKDILRNCWWTLEEIQVAAEVAISGKDEMPYTMPDVGPDTWDGVKEREIDMGKCPQEYLEEEAEARGSLPNLSYFEESLNGLGPSPRVLPALITGEENDEPEAYS